MKKIYFIIIQDGYWRGLVTTNQEKVNTYKLQFPNARIESTELKEIDFVPQNATIVGREAAMDWKWKEQMVDFSKYLYFIPVYKKQQSEDKGIKWVQLIRKDDLPALEDLVECSNFSEYLLGSQGKYLLPAPPHKSTIIAIFNVVDDKYFFTTDHCQKHGLGENFVPCTHYIPQHVTPRESLPSGIITNKEDWKKVFGTKAEEIPNPDPACQA